MSDMDRRPPDDDDEMWDPELEEYDPLEVAPGDELPERRSGRPMWVVAAAGLAAVAMIITSVPLVLWGPILLVVFLGFILWRAVGPRRP